MIIRIGSNIMKYRKAMGITQSELAEYLGVSPQAVSKWEQEASVPDIYLIPKIALFFSISIDTLFGTTELDTINLLVSRYTVHPNDKNYKEALEAINNVLSIDSENTTALKQLIQLEFHKAQEFLSKGKDTCHKLLASSKDKSDQTRATIQLIRTEAMLGNTDLVEEYIERFETTKSVDDFNYLLVALGTCYQHEKMLDLGNLYLHSFSLEDQLTIYPNLMEAAYILKDIEYAKTCFEFITTHTTDNHQTFNAWWLLWKTYEKIGNYTQSTKCKDALITQLPDQGYNEFILEKIHKQLTSDTPSIINVL